MPSLAAFRQRLTVRAKLDLLDASESAEYLIHQVRAAGGRPEWIFGDDVLDILTHAANGNPRILNQVAHAAFMLADEAEQGQVDAEAAVEAVTRLGLDPAADAETLATDEDPVRLIARDRPSILRSRHRAGQGTFAADDPVSAGDPADRGRAADLRVRR